MAVGLRLINKALEKNPEAQKKFRLTLMWIAMAFSGFLAIISLIAAVMKPFDIFGYFPLVLYGSIFIVIILNYRKYKENEKSKEAKK